MILPADMQFMFRSPGLNQVFDRRFLSSPLTSDVRLGMSLAHYNTNAQILHEVSDQFPPKFRHHFREYYTGHTTAPSSFGKVCRCHKIYCRMYVHQPEFSLGGFNLAQICETIEYQSNPTESLKSCPPICHSFITNGSGFVWASSNCCTDRVLSII